MEDLTLEQKVRDFKCELLLAQNDFLREKLMEAYKIIDELNKETTLSLLKEAV